MAKLDDRASAQQRLIYNLCCEAYPEYEVVHEYPIHEINQRMDIFIPMLAICIEVHGEQHYKPIGYFYKNADQWYKAVDLDLKKLQYLHSKGVKVVEVPYNKSFKNADIFKNYVESVNYPPTEYTGLDYINPAKKAYNKAQKLWHKNRRLAADNN
jgi:hypothetical protein